MYIDSHAHINFANFDDDREEVIQRAKNAGLEAIINVGIDIQTSKESIKLAETHDFIFAAAGIHPHEADKAQAGDWQQLDQLLDNPKVVAIGEIGLDFYRDYSPREVQLQTLRRQLKIAAERKMPIIVHTRNAWSDIIPIFENEFKDQLTGVFHCFSGDVEMAKRVLEWGFHVSFTGVVTFKNARALAVAREVPLDRLLLETDCPFMAPVPFRGKRCEPAYVPFIAAKIAEAKQIDEKILAQQTSKNVRELFGLNY